MSLQDQFIQQLASQEANKIENIIKDGIFLSNESRLEAFVDTVKNNFVDFTDRIGSFLNQLKPGNYNPQSIDYKPLLAVLAQSDYQNNRMLVVAVPSGFSGNWLEYMHFVHGTLLPIIKATPVTLDKVITTLAICLSDADRMKAQSGIKNFESGLTLVTDEQLARYKSFFKGSNTQAKFYEVVERQSDIEEAYKSINALNRQMTEVDFVKINRQVARVVELTKALTDRSSADETKVSSGLVVGQMSELFYKLAQTLQLGGIVMDGVTNLTDAMKETVDLVSKQKAA